MARDADFMLTPEERLALRRKRRRRIIFIATALALVVAALFAARPAANAIKGWQARRHAAKAFAFIEQQRWQEAKDAAVAAYQLRSSEPEAVRAIARFLTRTGQHQALDFWDRLAKQQSLTRDDRRDEAVAAQLRGIPARAAAAVDALLAADAKEITPADWLLAAQVRLQQNAPAKATEAIDRVLGAPAATSRERFQAVLLQLQTGTGNQEADQRRQRDAWQRLDEIAKGEDAVALDALTLLARQHVIVGQMNERAAASTSDAQIQPADGGNPDLPAAEELIRRLEAHPLAKAAQKLLAIDLRLHADPSQRDQLIARAIAEWKDSDAPSLATLAAWLNGRGAFQLNLDTIPLESAVRSESLFLQRLDALGALGRWEEIRQLLEAERFPLDPVIQHMYLARCNLQLGHKAAAENSWQRALEAAAGDLRKLMRLADYAEKNGAVDVAESAYATVTTDAPKLREAWLGRLRIARMHRQTKQMHELLAAMLQLWPDDTSIANDEAYTRLLLLPSDGADQAELEQIERKAAALVQADPASFARRASLALARLKLGRPDAALEAYKDYAAPLAVRRPLSPAIASGIAVHAAVFAALGQTDAARRDAELLQPNDILPEEEVLIAPLLRDAVPAPSAAP